MEHLALPQTWFPHWAGVEAWGGGLQAWVPVRGQLVSFLHNLDGLAIGLCNTLSQIEDISPILISFTVQDRRYKSKVYLCKISNHSQLRG